MLLFLGWVGPWDGEQGNSDLGSICEAYFLGKKNFKQVWQNMGNCQSRIGTAIYYSVYPSVCFQCFFIQKLNLRNV